MVSSVLGAFVLTTLLSLPPTTSTTTLPLDERFQGRVEPAGPTLVTAMPLYEWAQAEIPYAALPR